MVLYGVYMDVPDYIIKTTFPLQHITDKSWADLQAPLCMLVVCVFTSAVKVAET